MRGRRRVRPPEPGPEGNGQRLRAEEWRSQSRKQAQAADLARRRAEVVIEELIAHGVRRGCLEGVAGGADDTAGVDIDLGFYDEEPQREELSIVLVEKGDDESSVTSPWRPGDPRGAIVRSSFDDGFSAYSRVPATARGSHGTSERIQMAMAAGAAPVSRHSPKLVRPLPLAP